MILNQVIANQSKSNNNNNKTDKTNQKPKNEPNQNFHRLHPRRLPSPGQPEPKNARLSKILGLHRPSRQWDPLDLQF